MSSKFYSNGECKKFQPNIFNKIKCTYCFKPKEEHSNEALESNRVTRKAVKCGYLFVAPFSDFSNPINKTKRWQRRWFVLYDDGELKYALDDYPETVPQACIDMNKVLDVANAEERTGHPFSLSVSTADHVHYVKATCREEAQWWSDVLSSYKGHKTSKSSSGVTSTPYSTRITSSSNPSVWESGDIFPTRERDVQVGSPTNNENNMSAANVQTKIYVGSPPTRDKVTSEEKTRLRSSTTRSHTDTTDYSRTSPNSALDYSRTSTNNTSEYARTPTNNSSDFARTSTTNTSEFAHTPTSNNSEFSRTPTNSNSEFSRTPTNNNSEFSRSKRSEYARTPASSSSKFSARTPTSSEYSRTSASYSRTSTTTEFSRPPTSSNEFSRASSNGSEFSRTPTNSNEFSRASSNGSEFSRTPKNNSNVSESSVSSMSSTASRLGAGSSSSSSSSGIGTGSSTSSRLSNSSAEEMKMSSGSLASVWDSTDKSSSSSSSSGNLRRSGSSHSQPGTLLMDEKPVRGDPDGCGLDLSPLRRHSPTPELRLDLNTGADHYLHSKKGWLMKQSTNGQGWTKHWFVLRGCSLLFYRDPKAEEAGALDGVVALNNVTALGEVPVARNFGFQITTWDSKRTVLSAVTAGIRTNWMSAIKRTATLTLLEDKTDGSPSSIVQQDSPSTPRSILFSSDDEYRTASEGGRRGSTASDWGEILPPSPPLIRTPISRVKERARSISRSGGGGGNSSGGGGGGGGGGSSSRLSLSRSRSSPPSSRRSTLDSVRTEDLSLPCCGELPEPAECDPGLLLNEKLSSSTSPLLGDSRQHRLEVDELRVQLNNSLLELTNAEQEILSLKHYKLQVEELSKKLHRCEELLKQKTEELTEAGTYKSRYFQDKAAWEAELNAAELELEASTRRIDELCRELASSRAGATRLRSELDEARVSSRRELEASRTERAELEERLARGMEENESLYRRIRELEGNHHSLRESKGRSLDSLSDLTNVYLDLDLDQLDKDRVVEEFDNLRTRFEKAVSEIRVMKRELRHAHSAQDCVELSLIAMSQELKAQQGRSLSQQELMAGKIQDLTLKLSAAEKQVRAFRHKMSKLETRDKRHRSLSLKTDSKQSLSLCKELEEKLYQLEVKLSAVERGGGGDKSSLAADRPPGSKMTRLRRKSLDSVNEPCAVALDPMRILFRVTDLEKRINKSVSSQFSPLSQISENNSTSSGRDEDARVHPTSNIVILSEGPDVPDSPQRTKDESSRRHPNVTRIFPDADPRSPAFICSPDAEFARSRNDSFRSFPIDDDSAHTSLLNSIEYEVGQIESLVRQHSVSLSELDASADLSSSLRDAGWIADLTGKCMEIKQQIVSLQECLKEAGGVAPGEVCGRCSAAEEAVSSGEKPTACKQCAELEQQVSTKQEHCDRMEKMLQESEQALCRKQEELKQVCERCSQLESSEHMYKDQVERLSEEHKEKCRGLETLIREKDRALEWKRRELEEKMRDLANEYEEEKELLISVHEDQQASAQDKIRSLEARLGTLDSDYGQEIEKLRAAYEESVTEAGSQEFLSGSKYKHEMEHIKSLCEKGLQAMEFSYRRMIEELKAKHAEEVETLRQEKEQALREETEATLAALDVMRKAHDLEVEKKMNSIMKRMQASHDMSTLHSQHQAEMESIKQEIISLSEKYSAKCVESSDLGERLRTLTRSLAAARAHISDLEARNSKLRAHIHETE